MGPWSTPTVSASVASTIALGPVGMRTSRNHTSGSSAYTPRAALAHTKPSATTGMMRKRMESGTAVAVTLGRSSELATASSAPTINICSAT